MFKQFPFFMKRKLWLPCHICHHFSPYKRNDTFWHTTEIFPSIISCTKCSLSMTRNQTERSVNLRLGKLVIALSVLLRYGATLLGDWCRTFQHYILSKRRSLITQWRGAVSKKNGALDSEGLYTFLNSQLRWLVISWEQVRYTWPRVPQ